jgi:hypothetical protein
VGSFLRVRTCTPYFASADRYRPARFRLVGGSLPPGLSLWGDGEPAAQVDGTPRKVGSYRFTIEAADAAGRHVRATYTVEIHPRLVLPGGTLRPSRARVGVPYRTTVTARGGKPPYTFGRFERNGLTLDRSTGVISGTLSARGGVPASCPFRLGVTDTTGATASAIYELGLYDASGRARRTGCDAPDGVPLTWVTAISPRRGPLPTGAGTRTVFLKLAPVTITGRGLSNVTRVWFAGARAVFRVDSDRKITAIPPVGVHTGSVRLATADGRIRNAGIYRVYFAG